MMKIIRDSLGRAEIVGNSRRFVGEEDAAGVEGSWWNPLSWGMTEEDKQRKHELEVLKLQARIAREQQLQEGLTQTSQAMSQAPASQAYEANYATPIQVYSETENRRSARLSAPERRDSVARQKRQQQTGKPAPTSHRSPAPAPVKTIAARLPSPPTKAAIQTPRTPVQRQPQQVARPGTPAAQRPTATITTRPSATPSHPSAAPPQRPAAPPPRPATPPPHRPSPVPVQMRKI